MTGIALAYTLILIRNKKLKAKLNYRGILSEGNMICAMNRAIVLAYVHYSTDRKTTHHYLSLSAVLVRLTDSPSMHSFTDSQSAYVRPSGLLVGWTSKIVCDCKNDIIFNNHNNAKCFFNPKSPELCRRCGAFVIKKKAMFPFFPHTFKQDVTLLSSNRPLTDVNVLAIR